MQPIQILPGVLTYDENDFRQHLQHTGLRALAPVFHIDILDGSMFGATCWADPEIVGTWKKLPDLELHCMVQNPLPVIRAWRDYVPTVKRVIVHQEIGRSLTNVLSELRLLNLEIVVAVNPSTPIDSIARLPIDAVMIMGVEPGKSGQAFLGDPIISKIRRARALFPNLTIAFDGGLSEHTIGAVTRAGATRCVASSALWKAENPAVAYQELMHKVA